MTELQPDKINELVYLAEGYLVDLWDGAPLGPAWITHDDTCDIFMYIRDWGRPTRRGPGESGEIYYIACNDGIRHFIEFALFVDGKVTDLIVDTEFNNNTGILTIEDCHVK